jgi:hypothetical protein
LWTPLASDPVKMVVVRGPLRACAAALRRILGLARRPLQLPYPSSEQRDPGAHAEADTAVRLVTDQEALRRITGPGEQEQQVGLSRPARDASDMCRMSGQRHEGWGAGMDARNMMFSGGRGGDGGAVGSGPNNYNMQRCSAPTARGAVRAVNADASDDDGAPSQRSHRRRRRAGLCASQSPSPSVSSRSGSSGSGRGGGRWKSSTRGRTTTPSTPRCCKSESPAGQRPSRSASLRSCGRGRTESLSQSWSPATPGGRTTPSSPSSCDNVQQRGGRHTRRRRRGQSVDFPLSERARVRVDCDSENEDGAWSGFPGRNAPKSPAADRSSCLGDRGRHAGDKPWRDGGRSLQESPAHRGGTVQSVDGLRSATQLSSPPPHGVGSSLNDRPASISPEDSLPVSPSEEFESAKRAAAAAAVAAACRKVVAPSRAGTAATGGFLGGAGNHVPGQKRNRHVAANGEGPGADSAVVGGRGQRAGKVGSSDACTTLPSPAVTHRMSTDASSASVGDSEKRRRLQYGRPHLQCPRVGQSTVAAGCPGVELELAADGSSKVPQQASEERGHGKELLPTSLPDPEGLKASAELVVTQSALAAGEGATAKSCNSAGGNLDISDLVTSLEAAGRSSSWRQPQHSDPPPSNDCPDTENRIPGAQMDHEATKSNEDEEMESSKIGKQGKQGTEDRQGLNDESPDGANEVNIKLGQVEYSSCVEETLGTANHTFSGLSDCAKTINQHQQDQLPQSKSSPAAAPVAQESIDGLSSIVDEVQPQDSSIPEAPVASAQASSTSVSATRQRASDSESEMPLVSCSVLQHDQISMRVPSPKKHELCTIESATAISIESTATAPIPASAMSAATVSAADSVASVSAAVLPKDCAAEQEVGQSLVQPIEVVDQTVLVHGVACSSDLSTVPGQSIMASKSKTFLIDKLNRGIELQHEQGAEKGTDLHFAESAATSTSAQCPVHKKSSRGSAAGRRAAEYKAAAAAAAKAIEAAAGKMEAATNSLPAGSAQSDSTNSRIARAGAAGVDVIEGAKKGIDKDSMAPAAVGKASRNSLAVSEGKKARLFGETGKWMQCWSTEGRLYWHDRSKSPTKPP